MCTLSLSLTIYTLSLSHTHTHTHTHTHSPFRILNLNIGGLAAKLVSNDIIDYLNTFDLICLTETFVNKRFKITALKDFIFFIAPAKKLSRHGRCSGGVVVVVQKCFAHLFRQVTVKFDNFIVLESSKALFTVKLCRV